MTDEIIKLLDELAKRFGIAIDWTSENVMPYLMDVYDRFVTYQIVTNLVAPILFVILLTATIMVALKTAKDYKNEKDSFFVNVSEQRNYFRNEPLGITRVETNLCFLVTITTLGVASVIFAIPAFIDFFDLMKVIFVPEMFTIEWINYQIS